MATEIDAMKRNITSLLAYLPLLLCSACTAPPQVEKPTVQLQSLPYDEALQAYHGAGRDESYRCIHQAADDHYKTSADAKAVAIVIDDVLYLRLDGHLVELAQTEISEKAARYTNSDARIEAGYSIVKQFNFSEYNESDDRNVELWVNTPDGTQHVKAFGNRCGV
jgi:hypothetical protein